MSALNDASCSQKLGILLPNWKRGGSEGPTGAGEGRPHTPLPHWLQVRKRHGALSPERLHREAASPQRPPDSFLPTFIHPFNIYSSIQTFGNAYLCLQFLHAVETYQVQSEPIIHRGEVNSEWV